MPGGAPGGGGDAGGAVPRSSSRVPLVTASVGGSGHTRGLWPGVGGCGGTFGGGMRGFRGRWHVLWPDGIPAVRRI